MKIQILYLDENHQEISQDYIHNLSADRLLPLVYNLHVNINTPFFKVVDKDTNKTLSLVSQDDLLVAFNIDHLKLSKEFLEYLKISESDVLKSAFLLPTENEQILDYQYISFKNLETSLAVIYDINGDLTPVVTLEKSNVKSLPEVDVDLSNIDKFTGHLRYENKSYITTKGYDEV